MSSAGVPDESGGQPRDVRAKAKQYQAVRLRLLPLRLLLSAIFPVVVLAGTSQALSAFLSLRLSPWPLVVGAYFVLYTLSYTVWLLPLSFYQGYVVEQRFGLSTESAGSWLTDWLKGLAVSIVIGLPVVLVVYWLLRILPDWWWLAAGVVVTLFGVVLAKVAPIWIYPLFFKFEPLGDRELTERLAALGERSGAPVAGVFRMELSVKSKEAEALLTGTGSTRRIILSDTLLDAYDLDEIEVILAHELGHHARHHLGMLIAAQAVGALVGLYVLSGVLRFSVGRLGLTGIDDVAALPLLLLTLSLLQTALVPISNWWSRRLEAQADRFALQITSNPVAFARAMRKLADQNLSDVEPKRWVEALLYSHPAIGRRIETAREFARAHGLDEVETAGED